MAEERPIGEAKNRVSRLKRARIRKRRRRVAVLAALLAAVSLLSVGYLLEVPPLNMLRELEARVKGGKDDKDTHLRYAFLRLPRSGGQIEGDADALFALKNGDEVLALLLFTYDPSEGRKELLLLPEGIHAHNAQGIEVPLRKALVESEGRDLLRAAAESLSGASIEYLVVYDLEELVALVDRITMPPTRAKANMELVDPRGGRHMVSAGQVLRDSDRIISYLLAGDEPDPLGGREGRLRGYLDELLSHLKGLDEDLLRSAFDEHPPSLFHPDPAEELPVYLTSMAKAAADPGAGEVALRATPRVEVLNGCGVPQLGARVAEMLMRKGIRVSGSTGNAKVVVEGVEYNDFTHEKSLIRYGREERRFSSYAQYLGVLLNVTEVVYDPSVGDGVVLVAGRDAASGNFHR